MFTTILFASDGSAESASALVLTKQLALQDGANIEVVHVREYPLGIRSLSDQVGHAAAERETAVRRQALELATSGISVELTVTASTPDTLAAALAERADAAGADAIVVGADPHPESRSPTGRTVTQQLVQIAPCPVIVVPPRAAVRQTRTAGSPR